MGKVYDTDTPERPTDPEVPGQLDRVPEPAGSPGPEAGAAKAALADDDRSETAAEPFSGDPLEWAYTAPDGSQRRDTRGEGEVTGTGRKVRTYGGSKRPPGIDPALWSSPLVFSAKEKREAIAKATATIESRSAGITASPTAPALRAHQWSSHCVPTVLYPAQTALPTSRPTRWCGCRWGSLCQPL